MHQLTCIRMLSFRFGQSEAKEIKQVMLVILEGTRGIFDNIVELSDMSEKTINVPHSRKRRKH